MAIEAVVMAGPKKPVAHGPDGDRGPVKCDLKALGARVVSVFGPFKNRVLIEMDAERAMEMFPDGLGDARPSRMIDATEGEIESWRTVAPKVAASAYAAAAVAMAYEVEDPYNGATSKAYCAKELRETMTLLRGMLPVEKKNDGVNDIERKREERLAAARNAETEAV